MKRKQRILAIILLCSALVVMGIVQCLALDYTITTTAPADLGNLNTNNILTPGLYYIKIVYPSNAGNGRMFRITNSNNVDVMYIMNNGTAGYIYSYQIRDDNHYLNAKLLTNYTSVYGITQSYENYTITRIETEEYILISISNTTTNYTISRGSCEIYDVVSGENEQIYQNGYNQGYNEGFNAYQNAQENLKIVDHIEKLIAQFTGTEYARYITPIALVLTILMIYFLFIRFILSLMKAKGVIKTCDILMIVGCIIVLVIMYAPMLDITIKNETVLTETTTEVVEQVNRTKIVIEHTETGDIYYGPVGTAIIPIYEIADDTVTKAIIP